MADKPEAAAPRPAPATKVATIKELKRPEIVFAMARVPGPEPRRVVFGGSDFRVYDVDLAGERPEPKALGAHDSYITGLAVSATGSGRLAVSGGYDGKLIWWDLERGTRLRAVEAHARWIRDVAATPDGATIASVADDMVCRLWDASTGALRHELRGHAAETPQHYPSMLHACAFSPDGRHVATGDKLGHVAVWDVDDGRQVATLEAPVLYTWDAVERRHSIGGIRALAFSPDGGRLAVGGIGKVSNIDLLDGLARVEVFDWREGERAAEFAADTPKGIVERLAFHPDGRRLVAVGGGNDGFLLVFDLEAKSLALREKAPAHLHDVAFADPPDTLFTAGHGRLAVLELKG